MTETTGTALKLEHIELPLAPGSKITIWHPDTFDGFGGSPFGIGQCYTFDLGGSRWRAVLQTVSGRKGGTLMDLKIKGRYEQDEATAGPTAADD